MSMKGYEIDILNIKINEAKEICHEMCQLFSSPQLEKLCNTLCDHEDVKHQEVDRENNLYEGHWCRECGLEL